jgi:hypothetical protein
MEHEAQKLREHQFVLLLRQLLELEFKPTEKVLHRSL